MTALQLLLYISAALVVQIVAGVGAGVWHRRVAAGVASIAVTTQVSVPSSAAWAGWREFRVAAREFEDLAQTQCSFYLEPVDGVPLPAFLPGQYLTLAVPVLAGEPGVAVHERVLTRCYSLSDRPHPLTYRITVKRVAAPPNRPELAPGASSSHLLDQVHAGNVLRVRAPAGRFVVDESSDVPIVLVAGGIGVTPMMSMLLWCLDAQPGRTVHLYDGVRCASEQAFKLTLESLASVHPNFHLNVVYSAAGPDDVLGRDCQHAGRIDVDLLRRTLPHGRHQFYVCGPPAMMASLVPALRGWGVDAQDIRFESFGPASMSPMTVVEPLNARPAADALVNVDVQFLRSGRTLRWNGQDANLLDFAERQGVAVESGCRSGSCGSCEVRLVSGRLCYASVPDYAVASGCCLLCVGLPESALILDA